MPERWSIEKLVPGGEGLLKLPDGRMGFARGAFPGDVIEPQRLADKKQLVRAEQWKLIKPSPDRVKAPCALAETCGGCDWMGLSRGAQLANKDALFREALERTGGIRDLPPLLPIISTGPDLGYRGRLRLHVDERGKLGLFARHSHQLVEIPFCAVADEAVNRGMALLYAVARKRPGKLGAFSAIELRSSAQEPHLGIRLEPRALPLPEGIQAILDELATEALISVPGTEFESSTPQRWTLPGSVELAAPLDAFTQVNPAVNAKLVEAVVQGATERGIASALDLYAGAGNFSLPLAAAGLTVTAIELSPAAAKAALARSRQAGLKVEFQAGDVVKRLGEHIKNGNTWDLVLIDPPRTGARDALEKVMTLEPKHIAMCSCDPVTLARDLRELIDNGYHLTAVQAFDMFPHTHHLESLAWLSRQAPASASASAPTSA